VGLQAGAPPELRGPPPSSRQPAVGARAPEPAPVSRASTPPDDAKTIARPAPSLEEIMGKRAPGAPPRATPPKPGLPANSRPTPVALPGGPGVPPGARASQTGAPIPAGARASVTGGNPLTKTAPNAPFGAKTSEPKIGLGPKATGAASGPSRVATTVKGIAPAPSDDDVTGKRPPIDIDASVTKGTIEIGDDGLADAEAALEAMSSFRLAEGALQRNDLAAAQDHAEKAVAADPTQPDYVSLLAWIRALTGAPRSMEEAIRTMSRILIEDPSNEKALYYRGKLLVQTNRLHEALHDFNELLSANPHHRDAQEEARQLKGRVPQE
ncbi:MAG: hypothetical protein KF795_18655, partial [Labilithrix sp.]|nr:hypothetical protein [Labilithrix sp.]